MARHTGSSVVVPLVGALLQLYGVHWDIVWHLAIGRDTFWSPPHLLIYLGVSLVLASGLYPLLTQRSSMRAGSVVLTISALTQLLAAPIDDLWHRLYGLDVTIWSFPHLVGIWGGNLSVVGLALLMLGPSQRQIFGTLALLGLLVSGLTVALAEFAYRVPPPLWSYDLALYPPLLLGASLVIGLAGWTATRQPGALSVICLTFTLFELSVQLEQSLLGLRAGPFLPLLLPAALAADLVLSAPRSLPLPLRIGGASLTFSAMFWSTQAPYTRLLAPPAWSLELLARGAPLLALTIVGACVLGPALGGWLRRNARGSAARGYGVALSQYVPGASRSASP